MKLRLLTLSALLCVISLSLDAQNVRQKVRINNGWSFSLDGSTSTEEISLPHDWTVGLPFDQAAEPGNAFKRIGSGWPENSTGWYNKSIVFPASDEGKRIAIQFDGVSHKYQLFINDIPAGSSDGGFRSDIFDITEYISWDKENRISVRIDASENLPGTYIGAGIIGNVFLVHTGSVSVKPFSVKVFTRENQVNVELGIQNCDIDGSHQVRVEEVLYDRDGKLVAKSDKIGCPVSPFEEVTFYQFVKLTDPHRWSPSDPYLYTLHTLVYSDEELVDDYPTRVGIRDARFDDLEGFSIDGKRMKIKGLNIGRDHAGVGAAVPDELWRYRLSLVKGLGANAIRFAGAPAVPAVLDLCDEMGIMVIEECDATGINDVQKSRLKRMIERDMSHPSIVAWGIGDEHYPLENTAAGVNIARHMTAYAHTIDESRQVITGNCCGDKDLSGIDILGYNFHISTDIVQDKAGIGLTELSGAGTRGKYKNDTAKGWAAPSNRTHSYKNVIERSWRFYALRSWLAGMFYDSAFDRKGSDSEWPCTLTQDGVMDYCGFTKDEAGYLKAVWSNEPYMYITEAEDGFWIYSNCDEIQLFQNGKSIGRKEMPVNSHLVWPVNGDGGITASGFKKGFKELHYSMPSPGAASSIRLDASKTTLSADGQDIAVINVTVLDKDGETATEGTVILGAKLSGDASIIGWGNGDPAFRDRETGSNDMNITTFGGKAQLIVRSTEGASGEITVTAGSSKYKEESITISYSKQ